MDADTVESHMGETCPDCRVMRMGYANYRTRVAKVQLPDKCVSRDKCRAGLLAYLTGANGGVSGEGEV